MSVETTLPDKKRIHLDLGIGGRQSLDQLQPAGIFAGAPWPRHAPFNAPYAAKGGGRLILGGRWQQQELSCG
jgi:hypothetical protein